MSAVFGVSAGRAVGLLALRFLLGLAALQDALLGRIVGLHPGAHRLLDLGRVRLANLLLALGVGLTSPAGGRGVRRVAVGRRGIRRVGVHVVRLLRRNADHGSALAGDLARAVHAGGLLADSAVRGAGIGAA